MMEELFGTIEQFGLKLNADTQTQYNVFFRSAKIGQRVKMTLSIVLPEKTDQQLKGIFGGWISKIVAHMLEHGLTIPIKISKTETLQAIPNKGNVLMTLYAAWGNCKTLSQMDVTEASAFMEHIPDFIGFNSDFFHGLVLPELDPNWRMK